MILEKVTFKEEPMYEMISNDYPEEDIIQGVQRLILIL